MIKRISNAKQEVMHAINNNRELLPLDNADSKNSHGQGRYGRGCERWKLQKANFAI